MKIPSEDELLTTLLLLIEFFDEYDPVLQVYYKRHAFINTQKILCGVFDHIDLKDRKTQLKNKKQEKINAWAWKKYWRKMRNPRTGSCVLVTDSLKKVKNQRRRGIG